MDDEQSFVELNRLVEKITDAVYRSDDSMAVALRLLAHLSIDPSEMEELDLECSKKAEEVDAILLAQYDSIDSATRLNDDEDMNGLDSVPMRSADDQGILIGPHDELGFHAEHSEARRYVNNPFGDADRVVEAELALFKEALTALENKLVGMAMDHTHVSSLLLFIQEPNNWAFLRVLPRMYEELEAQHAKYLLSGKADQVEPDQEGHPRYRGKWAQPASAALDAMFSKEFVSYIKNFRYDD